jgi:hypothetical protein
MRTASPRSLVIPSYSVCADQMSRAVTDNGQTPVRPTGAVRRRGLAKSYRRFDDQISASD